MFDLERSITEWRRTLLTAGVTDRVIVEIVSFVPGRPRRTTPGISAASHPKTCAIKSGSALRSPAGLRDQISRLSKRAAQNFHSIPKVYFRPE